MKLVLDGIEYPINSDELIEYLTEGMREAVGPDSKYIGPTERLGIKGLMRAKFQGEILRICAKVIMNDESRWRELMPEKRDDMLVSMFDHARTAIQVLADNFTLVASTHHDVDATSNGHIPPSGTQSRIEIIGAKLGSKNLIPSAENGPTDAITEGTIYRDNETADG